MNRKTKLLILFFIFQYNISAEYLYFKKEPIIKDIVSNIPSGVSAIDYNLISQYTGKENWTLCFDSEVDSPRPNVFHEKCDGHSHTVSILEYNGRKFGGYSNIDWGSPAGYYHSKEARLIDFDNQILYETGTHYTIGDNAIRVDPNIGPSWRAGHDLSFIYPKNVNYDFQKNGGYCSSHTYKNWNPTICGIYNNNLVGFSYIPKIKVYILN